MAIGFGNNLTEEELLELGIEPGAAGSISGDVIDDYLLDPDYVGEGMTIEDLTTGDIETLGDVGTDDELETQDNLTENLNWMQENAPEWFSDWLYEAERPDLGGVDLTSGFGGITEDAVTEMASEGKWDRTSDLGRGLIQSGAYIGDFWKDLAMLPYNLAFDKEKPFSRLWEHPKWAEDIGYESDWGQSFMEDERVRWIQENLLPYAGPGIVAKTGLSGILRIPKVINKIPGLRKILETVYPTTMKGFKQGLMPAIRPGNIPFNVGLPYLWNQIGKKVKGEPTDYERGWQNLVAENTNFSPISSAHAADVPSRGDYAAGPMDYLQTPRPVTQRHPREMMEQSYNVRRSPELTTQSDYERLQQENIAAGKPRYLAHGA